MGKIFEIRFAHSGEVLANQLSEQKAIELLEMYKRFFGKDSVIIAYENSEERRRHTSWAQEYKNDYISYFGELQEMGNLL